ncbi:hypothetical protein PR048_033121 [Dryococelus australis]|uniref:Uncharacterized protein n=1 Tax=Dryococelus australis TaxID=614101 RepID=A0ABQ9G265_9NEOP|nr:hypothetical protein PR048_033121 [Dryococelus australis]
MKTAMNSLVESISGSRKLEGKILYSQRLICDLLGDIGGVKELHNLKISKMLSSRSANAHHRYISYSEEQKLAAKTTRICEVHIDKQIEKDIPSLTQLADELPQKAEHCGDMALITSSNSLHWTAKEKTA